MKKVILCSCLVAALLCCLIVPSFAANWFGGTTEVLDCYSYHSSASEPYAIAGQLPYMSANASTAARDFTIGDYSIVTGNSFYVDIVSGGYCSLFVNGTEKGHLFTVDTTIYIEESSFTGYPTNVRECTPVYVTVGSDGFVSSGFSNGLSIAGTVLNFCASNTYVLIAIGLAVGVPLVGWGISKLKSLIKGY